MSIVKCFFILLLIGDSRCSFEQPKVESNKPKATKKLSFIFVRSVEPDVHFYCPQQHYATVVEDLCYHFYPFKKTHNTAEEVCRKASHRLAEIDGEPSWSGVYNAVEKFYKSSLNLSSGQALPNLRFHLGSVYKLPNTNSDLKFSFLWNSSHTQVHESYLCRNASNFNLAVNFNLNCLELLINEVNYVAESGQRLCLKPVDCQTVRYSVCEWRGGGIPEFGLELKSQLVNAYISVVFVMFFFFLVGIMLYVCHCCRNPDEISAPLDAYRDELELFA
jgi:hypothetical protein